MQDNLPFFLHRSVFQTPTGRQFLAFSASLCRSKPRRKSISCFFYATMSSKSLMQDNLPFFLRHFVFQTPTGRQFLAFSNPDHFPAPLEDKLSFSNPSYLTNLLGRQDREFPHTFCLPSSPLKSNRALFLNLLSCEYVPIPLQKYSRPYQT